MYKYLLGKHPKKSPGLPFFKVKLNNDKKTNIGKKMNKSAIDLSRDTELLVLGNNYLSQKNKNNNNINSNKRITIYRQYIQEGKFNGLLNSNKNKDYKTQRILRNVRKKKEIVSEKLWLKAKKEYLTQRLNKILSRENNKKKALKTTTLIYESNKTNRTNNIKTKNYTNIYTNRKNESNTQRTNTSNLLSKSSKQEKELFEKLFYNKDVKKNTYRNIKHISNLLEDTTKNSVIINMNLKNYSQDASFKTLRKNILDKSLKQSKSQDNIENLPKVNMRKIFGKKDNILNRPMKQMKIRENKKNQFIWIKRSTVNLLSFGQVSQSMNDEQFYRERKRIIENYKKYEKDAGIYIKKRKGVQEDYRSVIGYKNIKKIDELIEQNSMLLKQIMEKDYNH